MDGYFVVRSHLVDFGENGASEKLVGVVMDMSDGVAFGSLGICNYNRGATRCRWVRYIGPKTMNSERRAVPSCNMASNLSLVMVSRSGARRRSR
jgi:hypothetical protein